MAGKSEHQLNAGDLGKFLGDIFRDSISADRKLLIFRMPQRFSTHYKSLDEAISFLSGPQSPIHSDLYFGLGLISGDLHKGRGTVLDTAGIGCLWADIDIDAAENKSLPGTLEEALGLVESLPIPPSKIVHSGRGIHVYWLLKEFWVFGDHKDVELDRVKASWLTKGWHQLIIDIAREDFGWSGLVNCGDLTRVLRIPGSLNHKPDCGEVVRVIRDDDGKRYEGEDFEQFLAIREDLTGQPIGGTVPLLTDEMLEIHGAYGVGHQARKQLKKEAEEIGKYTSLVFGGIGDDPLSELIYDPAAQPPAEKLLAAYRSDVFIRTFEMRRDDLRDLSPSGYDMSLVTLCQLFDWTPQETLNCLISMRRQTDKPGKASRPGYFRTLWVKAKRTIERIKKDRQELLSSVDFSGILDSCLPKRIVVEPSDQPHLSSDVREDEARIKKPSNDALKRSDEEYYGSVLFGASNRKLPDRIFANLPDGLLGMSYEWTMNHAIYPDPNLSLGGALAFTGMMMGRKVSDQTNIRTNVMVTCLAPSGSGKDAPKSAANILVERACLPSCRIGSEVASAEGVYDWMELAGQSLFIVDEIDLFLAKMANEEKGGLTKAFLEFHNHARGTAKSRARAGMTEVKSLNQPHLCLLGFSIPRFFFEQLNDRMLAGGLAARLMVFETPGRGKKNKHMQHDPDQSLIDEVRWWEDYVPNVNFVGNGVSVADRFYRPIRVDMDYDAVQVFNDLFDYENQKMAEGQAINSDARTSVWCRLCEKAKTLALIHACSRDRDGAIVNKESAQWAADLATCMSANILAMLDLHGYEGEFDLKRKKFVKAMVRWHTENGADAWMPSWQLSRTLRSWSKKELSDMRETLLEQQCIECATQISSGRPGLAFRLKRMDGTGIL